MIGVEGFMFPFVGFAFSPEKTMFNFGPADSDKVDHSHMAVKHAQWLANFLVDEARLGANKFDNIVQEELALIHNYNAVTPADHFELYLLK